MKRTTDSKRLTAMKPRSKSYEALLAEPKLCRRCEEVMAKANFPTAVARGRITMRAMCRVCYRVACAQYNRTRRAKAKASR